jgi:hypothetical protein
MRLGAQIAQVNMMTWPAKHDFRLRSESLRSAGNVGDILRIERAGDQEDYDYYVEMVPRGSSVHEYYSRLCTETAPHSDKRWGYYF